MLEEGFKSRFKYDSTIPFAFYKQHSHDISLSLISHQHKELELIAMIDGAADFYVDAVRYELKKGDVLVIPPCCIHRASIYPFTSYDCICFDLSLLWDEDLKKGLEKGILTAKESLSAERPYTAAMNNCIRSAVKARERSAPGWEMDVIGNLSILFAQLKKISFFIESGRIVPEHLFEKSVLEYVAEHFSEPITSKTVASVLYLNNSYFCRLFKKSFGCCFGEYLLEYRIEKAKFQLNNTDQPISDISSKTGFNSFSYFSKVFKTIVGVSPSEYRRRNV